MTSQAISHQSEIDLHVLRATFDSSLNAKLIVDHRTGQVRAMNRRFFEIFNIPVALQNTTSDQDLLNYAVNQIKDKEQFLALVAELYAEPLRRSLDRIQLIDGRSLDRHSEPLMMGGTLLGRVWYFRDVTEELRQQDKLAHASKMASLGEMAGGIAHEINNPLAIILARAEQMLRRIEMNNIEPEKLTSGIQQIMQVATRIEKIVKGLRSFARDGIQDPPVTVNLQSVLQESIDISCERIKNHGIQLNVELPQEPVLINARQVQIMQIIVNLLNNAHDAVINQPNPEISLRLVVKDNNTVEVRVRDSGPGVPVDLRSKIMQPFFTTKDPNKGTGLGLSIALAISHEHGGHLELDCNESANTFVLTLPRVFERGQESAA